MHNSTQVSLALTVVDYLQVKLISEFRDLIIILLLVDLPIDFLLGKVLLDRSVRKTCTVVSAVFWQLRGFQFIAAHLQFNVDWSSLTSSDCGRLLSRVKFKWASRSDHNFVAGWLTYWFPPRESAVGLGCTEDVRSDEHSVLTNYEKILIHRSSHFNIDNWLSPAVGSIQNLNKQKSDRWDDLCLLQDVAWWYAIACLPFSHMRGIIFEMKETSRAKSTYKASTITINFSSSIS